MPTLIFDVGGVVVRHDNALLHERLAALCADPDIARPRLADGTHDHVVGTGVLTMADLHARLQVEHAFKADYRTFLDVWSSHFSELPGMADVVTSLAARYRTVWFSNTNAGHWAHLTAHYPVFARAHHAYLSHELGLVKPDPAAYRRVLELEGCAPADAIFVDDRAENVAAAVALGIDGILFTGTEPFAQDLAARGVIIP